MVEKNDTASISLSKGFLIGILSLAGGGAATGAILGHTAPAAIEANVAAQQATQQAATLLRLEESQKQQAEKLGKVAEAVARIEGQLNSRK